MFRTPVKLTKSIGYVFCIGPIYQNKIKIVSKSLELFANMPTARKTEGTNSDVMTICIISVKPPLINDLIMMPLLKPINIRTWAK